MKVEYRDNPYGSGKDDHDMEEGFDYMLLRQDWNGTERVYFNKEDIEQIYEKIGEGILMIHGNYSILYSKTEELLSEIEDLGCYSLVKE